MKVLTGGSSLEEGRSSNCASRPRSSWRLLSGCLRPCRVDARHCSMRALISFPMTTESLFLMEVELTELQTLFRLRTHRGRQMAAAIRDHARAERKRRQALCNG